MAFLSVQYLRAIAALMIVVFHVLPFASALQAGVDIFFVTSGFIMWHTTQNGVTPRKFITNRLIRIVPLYWAVTLFVLGVAFLRPDLLVNSVFDLQHAITSMLFIPWPDPVYTDKVFPVVMAGWTLNYEMLFYVVFALGLFLQRRFILLYLMTIFLLIMSVASVSGNFTVKSFYANPIMLEFIFGAFIGSLMTDGVRVPLYFALAIGSIGVVLISLSGFWTTPRFVEWGIPASMIIFGAVFYEIAAPVPRIAILKLLGDASYSIYLTHGLLMAGLIKIFVPISGTTLFHAAIVPVACLVGIASYLIFEKPTGMALKRQTATA